MGGGDGGFSEAEAGLSSSRPPTLGPGDPERVRRERVAGHRHRLLRGAPSLRISWCILLAYLAVFVEGVRRPRDPGGLIRGLFNSRAEEGSRKLGFIGFRGFPF